MTFIATIEIDEVTFSWLDALRRAHFPAERNFLSAHLTLFHTLQSEQVDRLRAIGLPRHASPLEFTGVRFLGAGGGRMSPCRTRSRRIAPKGSIGNYHNTSNHAEAGQPVCACGATSVARGSLWSDWYLGRDHPWKQQKAPENMVFSGASLSWLRGPATDAPLNFHRWSFPLIFRGRHPFSCRERTV
jgi:hypothetical protein